MTTYKIVRKFQDRNIPGETIKEGLTLEEAQEYCNDPETSSMTCENPEGIRLTEKNGPWFDCFYEE